MGLTKMKQANIFLDFNEDIHAKIIILNRKVAVIMSMNFTKKSMNPLNLHPYASYEAGLVTLNDKIVTDIRESVRKIPRIT